jgi:hypothetical protein
MVIKSWKDKKENLHNGRVLKTKNRLSDAFYE